MSGEPKTDLPTRGRFRRRATIVEARQLTQENIKELMEWTGGRYWSRPPMRAISGIAWPHLVVDGEDEVVEFGQWIVQLGDGNFRVWDDDDFRMCYELVPVVARDEAKTLTPEEGTLAGLIATLGIHGYSLTFQEGRWWAVPPQDTPYEWCEGDTPGEAASKALGVRVVVRDEAAELRAGITRFIAAVDARDHFLEHEEELPADEWNAAFRRTGDEITASVAALRRLAGGEEQE